MSEKKKPSKSRTLMYVQQVRYLSPYFKSKDDIIAHLNKHFDDSEWAYILHDKDYKKGVKEEDHIHIAFCFPNGRSPSSVAKAMGDKPQSVEIFTGYWAKSNMFAYLLHATAEAIAEEGNHQYDVQDVTANFDFEKFVSNAKDTAESKKLDIEQIQADIISGNIILKDFFRQNGKLGNVNASGLFYANNRNKIDKAIETRYKIMMSSGEAMDLEVIYIQGASGSGKTTLAKEYAMRKYGDYFLTGSSNDTVQDYMGEPVAIFDDARPSDFKASDWLKMLDPYNNKSTVTSRYYNKYLAVKCIILTTTTPFEEFFVYTKEKGGVDEPVSQFMRRFKVVIDVKPETDSLGREYAVGQLYRVAKMKQIANRPVGQFQTMVKYDYETVKEDGKVIRVMIPESKTEKAIDDLMSYF